MSGTIDASGAPIALDLWIAKGKGANGSVTIRGAKVRLIVVGGGGYLNAPASFWTQTVGTTTAPRLAGRWVKVPFDSAGQFQPILAFANPQTFLGQLRGDSALKNSGATTYKGQSVVALSGTTNGTLYVAAAPHTPYPVALVKTGARGGAIVFGGWNEAVTLTAPRHALDSSHLRR